MFPRVILRTFPPMGVYETLFRFANATDTYMGDAGTHPWAQGFPITTPVPVCVEETEYTPYYDLLRVLGRDHVLIPSHEENRFRPTLADHPVGDRTLLVKSNPCNPTGVATVGSGLEQLVDHYSQPGHGALIDEAYEFYGDPGPESALRYIDDIDATDLFVVDAATKGLQVPGMRVGWVVAAKAHIEPPGSRALHRNWRLLPLGATTRRNDRRYVQRALVRAPGRDSPGAPMRHGSARRRRTARSYDPLLVRATRAGVLRRRHGDPEALRHPFEGVVTFGSDTGWMQRDAAFP